MAIFAKPASIRFIQVLRLAVVISTSIAVYALLRDTYGNDAIFVVDIPLISLIIVNLLSSVWLWQHISRTGAVEEEQVYLQVFLDVMLMGMVVFYTGASSSTLTLVFLLPVMLASAYLYLRGSLFAASLSTIVLATLFILDSNGWLADYGTNYVQAPLDFANDIYSQLLFARYIITVLVLFAVASISGYLAENHLSITGELIEATRRLERIRINTSDVLTHMESGLLTVDKNGRIIFLNRAAAEILQIEGLETEGLSYESVFNDRLEPIKDFVGQILKRSSDISTRNELQLKTREGSYMPLGLSPALLTEGDSIRGLIVVFQDLTQAKVTEKNIRRQDRLAVIGELAAGIAHELRNPLASISGSAEVLQSGLDVEGEDHQLLDLIVNESVRINDIVEQLLNYARIQKMDRQSVNLQKLVSEVITLVRNHPSYTEGKEVVVELDSCPPVLVDAAQMKQVFLNILLNGLEAVDGTGRICVCTSPEDEESIADQGQVEIWVQDDGPGIPEELFEIIFEPFHTNKRGGTGLGLAVAYKIMESNDGRILYAPSSDGKSTFRVLLPTAEEVI